MSNKLKPCPFCGGEAELSMHFWASPTTVVTYYAVCTKCSCRMQHSGYNDEETREDIIEAWNRRVDDGKVD